MMPKQVQKRTRKKQNTQYATASLVFGILCIVPLFNFLSSPLSIVFGIIALYKANKQPTQYAGVIRAVIGLSIGVLTICAALYGYFLFGEEIFLRQ